MSNFRIGIDIGGTFTDLTLSDAQGRQWLWKEDSTPDEPEAAVFKGIAALAQRLGFSESDLLARVDRFVHGSTIATNTVIERSSGAVGLLTTEGFRDVLYFRDAFKPQRFNVRLERPRDFVRRELRLGVRERIDRDGAILTALDEAQLHEAIGVLRDAEVSAVAVSFLWSMVNPQHEVRAAEIVADELGVPVVCSHNVLPEIGEWERTSATVLSAYVLPRLGDYLRRLESRLGRMGLQRRPLIMQITGGTASVDDVLNRPVSLLASGPAAAPSAALHYAKERGFDNVITMDMGGTSLDVSLIRDGDPVMTRDVRVEEQPIGVAAVDVHSIGAGGGSIAWIDDGGALRVGPRSAGSRPGPVCYDQGGVAPTVTDANVVLGYLDPDSFLGGRRTLRRDLACEAIKTEIATPLGLSVEEAAAGILEVVDTSMAQGIRAVTVERGLDPRDFLMVSAGGAGGLHATRLARELGIRSVLVPREASTFCSFGMTVADVRHDYTFAWHQLSHSTTLAELNDRYETLEKTATECLAEDGFEGSSIDLMRLVDARYPSQIHEITIPFPAVEMTATADLDALTRAFHTEHHRQFSYSFPELPVEFLHWRLRATGRVDQPSTGTDETHGARATNGTAAPPTTDIIPCYSWGNDAHVDFRVVEFDDVVAGLDIQGPAIVRSPITTVILGADDRGTVGHNGSILITCGHEQTSRAERSELRARRHHNP